MSLETARVFRGMGWYSLLLPVALAACSSTTDPLSPFQLEVSSVQDNFQLQATDVTGVTATVNYGWNNGGGSATVNHSTTTSSGRAELVIRDDDGKVVYQHILVPSLNEVTGQGLAGRWRIELHLTDYVGTLNFRVQRQ